MFVLLLLPLPLQCIQLQASLRRAEGRCKSLVFQKHYLLGEQEAFYHTQQASLMLLRDMGAPVDTDASLTVTHHCTGYQRFKMAAIAVVAAIRIQRLVERRQQRLQRALHRCCTMQSPQLTVTAQHSRHGRATTGQPQVGAYLKKLEKLQERLSGSTARHTTL